jgi:hypothetical protein
MPQNSGSHHIEQLYKICSKIEPFFRALPDSWVESSPIKISKNPAMNDEFRIQLLNMVLNLKADHVELPPSISSKLQSLVNSLPPEVTDCPLIKKAREILFNEKDDQPLYVPFPLSDNQMGPLTYSS